MTIAEKIKESRLKLGPHPTRSFRKIYLLLDKRSQIGKTIEVPQTSTH